MRTLLLVMACVTGCVAGDEELPSPSTNHPKLIGVAPSIANADHTASEPLDVCTLAAQLPAGDLCALMCDPDAMKAQLIAEGAPAGTCLDFNCELPDTSHVVVGVCLPPPNNSIVTQITTSR